MTNNVGQHPGRGNSSGPRGADAYIRSLPPDSHARHQVASPDAVLIAEVRLMRTLLAHLAEDIPANHRDIVRTVVVLARVTPLHLKQEGANGRP